ncbi:MAG: prenyltransferase [Bacteroidales bacterium]|nr:prenyltransferase [Bacteroidales bacterium]
MNRKHHIKNYLIAAHPWSFPASGMPALIAFTFVFYSYSTGVFTDINWINGILAVVGAVVFHASGNIMGDYYDYVNGVDGEEKTGPIRLLVTGYFKPKTILIYGLSVLAGGIILGIYLMLQSGLPLLFIGLLGILCSVFYYKLKYIALGELVVFIAFSQLIGLGVVYAMTSQLVWSSLLVVAPTGLLVVSILHANNTRDLVLDKQAGIKTQAIILGIDGSKIFYQTLMLAPYILVAFIVKFQLLHPYSFAVLLSFPIALKGIKKMKQVRLNALHEIQTLDVDTSKLVAIFSLLLIAGNVIGSLV